MNLKKCIERMEGRLPSGSDEHLVVDLTEGLLARVERMGEDAAGHSRAPGRVRTGVPAYCMPQENGSRLVVAGGGGV